MNCRRFALQSAALIWLTHVLRAAQRSATTASKALHRAIRDLLDCVVTKFPRAPRRLEVIFPRNPLYFVTCCTYRRRPHLANNHVHEAFVKFNKSALNDFGIAVGRYVILPDHLHLFVALPDNFKLGDWVGTLKRVLARSLQNSGSGDLTWQRGFFDHVLRSSESYSEKWNYVRENPVRAGLVKNANDWPFCGEIVDIYYR